jgi:hypothetical protein
MPHRRAIVVVLVMTSLVLPQDAPAGALYIDAGGGGYGNPCWCDALPPITPYGFPVIYSPATRGECDVVSVAFRIEGVPGDPALERRFEMAQAGWVTGDPFGDGAIVQGLMYEGIIGWIRLSLTTPLLPQVWSVQPHRGIPGVTAAVAAFEGELAGPWMAQAAYSSRLSSTNPQCDACAVLNPWPECPFAVEPGTWSMIKRIYL